MTVITYREAVKRALDEEMARDENVIFFGESEAFFVSGRKKTNCKFNISGFKKWNLKHFQA